MKIIELILSISTEVLDPTFPWGCWMYRMSFHGDGMRVLEDKRE
jgi:hypothetical protein